MNSTGKVVLATYAIIGAVHVFTCYYEEYHQLHVVTKLALMPVLLLAVWTDKPRMKGALLVSGALLLSWLGDGLLIGDSEESLLGGLGAFLVAHVLYIVAFRKCRDDNHELPLMKRYPLLALVIVAAAGLVFIKIREDLGEMELPVLVYTIVITTMSITALNRQAKTSRASFAMVMAGALLFMTSDSLIAWDRFHSTIDLASVWIMLTYIAAQGLIVYGLMAGRKADFEGSTTDA